MDFLTISSIIGISSIISIIISYIFDILKRKKSLRFEKHFEEKYIRYNHILAHMLIIIDTSNLDSIAKLSDRDIFKYKDIMNRKGSDDLKSNLLFELKQYINFYYLFSSNKVIEALLKFVETPNEENYINSVKEMKKDLWK